MIGLKNSIKMTKASSRPYVPTPQWIHFYGIWIDIPEKKSQGRLWIFPLLARYFKVPCHWRVPGPNKNLEKTQKPTHVLHQAEVSNACKIHASKENRRFRIRLEDFRKKVIPDNETNTVDIRVGDKNGRVGWLRVYLPLIGWTVYIGTCPIVPWPP